MTSKGDRAHSQKKTAFKTSFGSFMPEIKVCCLSFQIIRLILKDCSYLPINNGIIKKKFNICSDLVKRLSCYWFYFKPDESIWRFLDGYLK